MSKNYLFNISLPISNYSNFIPPAGKDKKVSLLPVLSLTPISKSSHLLFRMWPGPVSFCLQEDEATTLSLLFLLFTTESPGDYPWNKEKIQMMKRRDRPIRDLGTQGMTWWWVTWNFFWPHLSRTEVRGVRHWHQKPGLFRPTTRKRAAFQHRKHSCDNCSLQSNTTGENFNKVWVEGLVPPSADHREHASTPCRGGVREGRGWDFHHY